VRHSTMKLYRAILPISSLLVLANLSFSFNERANAQNAVTPERDPEALKIVYAALGALGGQTALAEINDATVSGTCAFADETNGSITTESDPFTWTVTAKEFRYEHASDGQTHVAVSGYGSPSVQDDRTSISISPLIAATTKPYHLPGFVLLHELQDSTRSILYVGVETLPTGPVSHIRITTVVGHWPVPAFDQDWYFDAGTGLPEEVIYKVPTTDSNTTLISVVDMFQSYGSSNGILFVQNMSSEPQGLARSTCTLQAPQWNTNPSSSKFELAQ
jgi:hypothetical protein